jgi:hypothetical protein
MMKFFNLDFHGTRFHVPKPSLFNLFEHQRSLFDATSCDVQSSVPLGLFEVFVDALERGTKVEVKKENVNAFSLLAKEFWLEDLLTECSALQVASSPEPIRALSERISKLERQLESLDCRISALEPNLGTGLEDLKLSIAISIPVPPVSLLKSLKKVRFPFKEAKSLDGVISYLTRKHGGHVHDKGIVTITSKSVHDDRPKFALRNIADLTSDSYFYSKDEPDQWFCCDFHEMRVCPTHYTIASWELQSWVIKSSLEGRKWIEIDRRTNTKDFKDGLETVSFAVSTSSACRFIRLTQTGKRHHGDNNLRIQALEFFGTLLE